MRLGEILIAAGFLSESQLTQALNRQRDAPHERLGTHVVHLGFATPDQISQALAKLHQVPPALVRHFVHHDPKVADLIGPKVAVAHSLLPIAFSRAGGRRLVICFRDPVQPQLIAKLERALGIPVTPCVASELAIGVYLDHYYGVQPAYGPAKSKRAESESESDDDFDVDIDDFDDPQSGLDTLQLVDLDHRDVVKAAPDVFVPESQRRSAIQQAMAAAQASSAGIDALDLIAAETAAAPAPAPARVVAPTTSTATGQAGAARENVPAANVTPELGVAASEWQELPDLLAEIAKAPKRTAVSDSIMRFLRQRFAGGMMFTIKDGLAMGHRGFGGHLDDKDTVTALMLPLGKNILGAAHDSKELWRGNPAQIPSAAQERFLKLFALGRAPSDVAVAPVTVGSRVVCLLYAHAHQGIELDDPDVEELAEVAEATRLAFARLIKKSRAATNAS